ncbi:hypothetical protein D9613_002633 [Agrocybe pediades]|uniref:Uncharacterized protein n=1 Tax=Agrocybe pediades TaxID=84607 RepID=A0A8H4QQ23_9AGAR|nr:hypothetical protein D9613_002633 [Agrocybe pediades]
MKKFFEKASKPFVLPVAAKPPEGSNSTITQDKNKDFKDKPKPKSQAAAVGGPLRTSRTITTTTANAHQPGLPPKSVLPPVPHPCPHNHLSLLATKDGLLIRPHIVDGREERSLAQTAYVRISWGKDTKIEEIEVKEAVQKPDDAKQEEEEGVEVDWQDAVVVYGIVGILDLFSCSYLLVITSRTEVGDVLDPLRTVYGVKGVTDIPLVEDRARIALNTLAARNAIQTRPSLIQRVSRGLQPGDISLDMEDEQPLLKSGDDVDQPIARRGLPRVQFLSNPALNKEIGNSIQRPSSAQSTSAGSDISSLSSEASLTTTPVFQTLASRLSFWSRLSKRTSPSPIDPNFPALPEPMSLNEEQKLLDNLMSTGKEQPEVIETILASTAPPPATVEEKHSEMETKVVRECIREFTKGDMYFAYNFGTRPVYHKQEQVLKSQKQHDLLAGLGALPSPENDRSSPLSPSDGKISPLTEPNPTLPLWRRVDKQFWWNEWMSKPFIDAGLHSYILPIMQGYCQVTRFPIPTDPDNADEDVDVDYIIISRRSRHRPGLRYQRRGIDDASHVANFVETETIMRVEREGKENVFAYIQIRGSIPLFWTQNGYGLKPPPVLAPDRTHSQNLEALKKHFMKTIPVYGPHTAVNLAEQHGKEGAVTQAYREYMQELGMKDAQYCEYDFHTETKGMKYENISSLIERMERTFEAQGYFWVSDNVIFSQQKGVFRVNCIDCLDRTNVVQSAFARYVLNKQLGAVALLNPSTTGRTEAELAFNDVWANNGDAISRAYAGTSALKGDFTRTGKRDLSGMLNDGVNSLARMYTSTFSDWFSQAVIDFMLGNRTISVFSEFLLKLKATDPRDLIRLSKIRQEAVGEAVARVLPEGERLLNGWTLFAPEELGVKIPVRVSAGGGLGGGFEEKVLLLSAKALYIVSYDYTLEKVKSYTRVPLEDIVSITKGAYIISPLEESSRDPEENAGFVVTWSSSNQESRVTSYSVRNSVVPGVDLSQATQTPPGSPGFNIGPMKIRTGGLRRSRTLPSTSSASGGNALSNILTGTAFGIGTQAGGSSNAPGGEASTSIGGSEAEKFNFAAFKVLPIDPARHARRGSSYNTSTARSRATASDGGYGEGADGDLQGAASCREAVDVIVDCIRRGCLDVSGGRRTSLDGQTEHPVVKEEDVVSLAEAQRMTSVYAKMEYGVKRLLWLGG